jgi:hypothetical protein
MMQDSVIHSEAMGKSLKMLERMVNQNRDDEIYQVPTPLKLSSFSLSFVLYK